MTFEEFLDAHLTTLSRYATALTCDPHLAQDVTQEVLLRAQRKWSRIGTLDSPLHYVRRMITNEYLSWKRRRAARDIPLPPAELARVGPAQDGGASHADRYDERDAMLARIAALPRRQRAALALRYYCDLSDAEVAKTMGCRPATVRTHIFRGLKALRAQPAGRTDAAPSPVPAMPEEIR